MQTERQTRFTAGWSRLLDWVYPGRCDQCGCGLSGQRSLCVECEEAIPGLRRPFCEVCGLMFHGVIERAFECPNCRSQRFAFEFARSGVPRNPGVLEMIHAFKYAKRLELGYELAGLAARAFDDSRLAFPLAERWPLVPVPLHRGRYGWRQFNQAEEIARHLGHRVGLPVCHGLKRLRATVTQTRLTRRQRQKNLKGAFEARVKRLSGVFGVILVDDVLTTGSTVHECAKVLRRAGVQKVIVVTVMRG